MKISELIETATAGATSAANVGIGVVGAHTKKKTKLVPVNGKTPKQILPKKQTPKDNALDKNVNIFTGQGLVKR